MWEGANQTGEVGNLKLDHNQSRKREKTLTLTMYTKKVYLNQGWAPKKPSHSREPGLPQSPTFH